MRRRGFLGLLVAAATAKPALAALSATPATLVLKEANTNTAPPPPPYSFSNCGHTALNCECNTLPRPATEFRADTNSGCCPCGAKLTDDGRCPNEMSV
jgi:hypothetical protein